MSSTAEAPKADEDVKRPSQLPLFEGHRVTDHTLSFSGNVGLEELELVKGLKLDEEVAVIIRGRVASRRHNVVKDEHGNTVKTVSSSTILIDSVTAYDE